MKKFKKHHKIYITLGVGLLLFVLYIFQKDHVVESGNEERTHSVLVRSVGALSVETDPLMLLGEVRSVSQAELRAEKSGEVTKVYVKTGQHVGAGTVLAEIQNQSERAGVLQAQGVLKSAQAQLEKIKAGARSEDKASSISQTQAANVSLQSAMDSARSAYSQAYTLAQDAIFAQADTFFSNPYTVRPSFRVKTASYDEKKALEQERVEIGVMLDEWKNVSLSPVSDEMIDTRLADTQHNLDIVKRFLSSVSSYVSEQEIDDDLTSTEKTSQEGSLLSARTNVDTARGTVNGIITSLAQARSVSEVAGFSEHTVLTGARSEDVSTAEAGVVQAQGALAIAQAMLENTLLRTPISGTVTTLNVSQGDFLAPMDVVAVVANEGALEIEVFVSDVARERIFVGLPVMVDGTYKGIVTTVSPGLDPVTKKSRITVSVMDEVSLVNGSYVEIAILNESSTTKSTSTKDFFIPISAIKVLPKGFAVFSVSSEGVLVAHTIEEGPIVGSDMHISQGLTSDLMIVTDVRGLSEGSVVTVQKNTE